MMALERTNEAAGPLRWFGAGGEPQSPSLVQVSKGGTRLWLRSTGKHGGRGPSANAVVWVGFGRGRMAHPERDETADASIARRGSMPNERYCWRGSRREARSGLPLARFHGRYDHGHLAIETNDLATLLLVQSAS